MKNVISVLTSRIVLGCFIILIQALVLIIVIWEFTNFFILFYFICTVISLLTILYIINGRANPAYKIAWILPIMGFPIFGGLFYLMFGRTKSSKKIKSKMMSIDNRMRETLQQNEQVSTVLENENKNAANQSRYIYKYSACPVYGNTETTYLTPGESIYEIMLVELRKAEKYIFLEYFIIDEGIMWSSILDILVSKVRQGVDVRLIYDDVGCVLTLPRGYNKKLESMGIKCLIHNPFTPVLSFQLNNRDHRKFAVIDGNTAFAGGINLADEYINAKVRHGHWKDAAIALYGDAAWSFSVMFLSLWESLAGVKEDYSKFLPLPEKINFKPNAGISDGYVQPFTDTPFDDEAIGESVYLNMINSASEYIYINSPYLILDNEMATALCLAAKRGVDVRIVTPSVPDKAFVHAVTRSNYEVLIECGVRIYEYTLGFMHAKTFVSDDMYAVVGTINLDYRSLYLHFECGVWLFGAKSVLQVKEDYIRTLHRCRPVTLEDCRKVKWYGKLCRAVLKIFAPLM